LTKQRTMPMSPTPPRRTNSRALRLLWGDAPVGADLHDTTGVGGEPDHRQAFVDGVGDGLLT
jgi:hypothetical protein